jgi:hypothetical protein
MPGERVFTNFFGWNACTISKLLANLLRSSSGFVRPLFGNGRRRVDENYALPALTHNKQLYRSPGKHFAASSPQLSTITFFSNLAPHGMAPGKMCRKICARLKLNEQVNNCPVNMPLVTTNLLTASNL